MSKRQFTRDDESLNPAQTVTEALRHAVAWVFKPLPVTLISGGLALATLANVLSADNKATERKVAEAAAARTQPPAKHSGFGKPVNGDDLVLAESYSDLLNLGRDKEPKILPVPKVKPREEKLTK